MDDRIRAAVNRSPDLEGLHNAALLGGMRTLTMSGLELAARGVTSLEEIWRVVPSSISE